MMYLQLTYKALVAQIRSLVFYYLPVTFKQENDNSSNEQTNKQNPNNNQKTNQPNNKNSPKKSHPKHNHMVTS